MSVSAEFVHLACQYMSCITYVAHHIGHVLRYSCRIKDVCSSHMSCIHMSGTTYFVHHTACASHLACLAHTCLVIDMSLITYIMYHTYRASHVTRLAHTCQASISEIVHHT